MKTIGARQRVVAKVQDDEEEEPEDEDDDERPKKKKKPVTMKVMALVGPLPREVRSRKKGKRR